MASTVISLTEPEGGFCCCSFGPDWIGSVARTVWLFVLDLLRGQSDCFLLLVFQSPCWTPGPSRGSWDGSPAQQKGGWVRHRSVSLVWGRKQSDETHYCGGVRSETNTSLWMGVCPGEPWKFKVFKNVAKSRLNIYTPRPWGTPPWGPRIHSENPRSFSPPAPPHQHSVMLRCTSWYCSWRRVSWIDGLNQSLWRNFISLPTIQLSGERDLAADRGPRGTDERGWKVPRASARAAGHPQITRQPPTSSTGQTSASAVTHRMGLKREGSFVGAVCI